MSPQVKNAKPLDKQELTNTDNNRLQTSLQTKPEKAPNPANNLPPELLSIVKVWPDLPEPIKQAIKALIQTHIKE